MELLRFATAGSVDDGKSTLIGRLLYDTKSIFEDQLESIERTSRDRGDEQTNLALLTDGLRAEREQGITIDVAYRYFATPRRKFIIADTPGHIQYTRNMVTGASTADLALILVDARKGLVEQSRRHAFLCSLLRVPHMVLCVNKMDLVDYSQEVFEKVADEFSCFAMKRDEPDVSRGDLICRQHNRPAVAQDIEAMVCWMDETRPMAVGGKYAIKHTTRAARAVVRQLYYRLDVNTLHRDESAQSLSLNEIGR